MSDALDLDAIERDMAQPLAGTCMECDYFDYLGPLIGEVRRLTADNETLRGGVDICVWCEFSIERSAGNDALRQHVETCEHHPLAAARVEVSDLQDRINTALALPDRPWDEDDDAGRVAHTARGWNGALTAVRAALTAGQDQT